MLVLKQKQKHTFSLTSRDLFNCMYPWLFIIEVFTELLNADQHEFNSYKFENIISTRMLLFQPRGESYLKVVAKYIANQLTASASIVWNNLHTF